jgi:hypothetical protein
MRRTRRSSRRSARYVTARAGVHSSKYVIALDLGSAKLCERVNFSLDASGQHPTKLEHRRYCKSVERSLKVTLVMEVCEVRK